MIFVKMVICTVLFWILISYHCVHGQDELFQAMYNAVPWVLNEKINKIEEPLEVYKTELAKMASSRFIAVILQDTSTSLHILAICGYFQSVIDSFIGLRFSALLTIYHDDDSPFKIQHVSEINTFRITCDYVLGFSYNISLVSSKNGTIIEQVVTDKWSGTTLASIFTESTPQFDHVKRISLNAMPLTELTINDLLRFPELRTLALNDMPIASMEDGLLCCYNNITIFSYFNSLGYLTTFPQQIFNCTAPLKLEYFRLKAHNIAYLPTNAFGNDANLLKYIVFDNIGLEIIHEDAFEGLMSVQFLYLVDNKLPQMSDTVLLPFSINLRQVQITSRLNSGVLNLTAMGVPTYSQLEMFAWVDTNVSDISGNFCSNYSRTELEIIIKRGNMISMLPPHIFDHCVSLKYLSITYERLIYLPERLFATNISQMERLMLMGNRLNSNTSWSNIFMHLQELRYLNLSANMLTSWAYNLSSLWKLEMLDLSHNAIAKISHLSFINMTLLKYLLLEDNNLAFLTSEVKGIFTSISVVHLGSNSISQLNISEDILRSNASILNVSANHLIQLDLPLMKKCIQPCGKISLFGDNNNVSLFTLPCSNTQQFDTVSLT